MRLILSISLFVSYTLCASLYLQADPFYLFHYEKEQFNQNLFEDDLNMRPVYSNYNTSNSNLYMNSWYYYNDNAPNLENTSNKWVAKGSNFYNSLHFDFQNDFLIFSIEPYFFTSENLNVKPLLNNLGESQEHTDPIFLALNSNRYHSDSPYLSYGLRESQIIFHKNDYGIGFSNTNLWWGPGLHNSLHISNNTSGFNYFYLGTNTTKKINDFGYNFKYIFSKLDKNIFEPYYTGLAGDITYFGNIITTLGFYRSFLSGGTATSDEISTLDAMILPFEKIFKKNLFEDNNSINPSDQADQTLSIFISVLFPNYKTKIFYEFGWNDHRWDRYDFFQHPDHSSAKMIGFRKYGLFTNDQIIFGIEYTDLVTGRYENRGYGSPEWYVRNLFDYHQYDGRRFTAHSGSDSDDFLIYLGYMSDKSDLIFSINHERHGVTKSVELSEIEDENGNTFFHVPEYKMEFKLDYRKKIKDFDIFFMYEFEYLDNIGIPHQGINPRFNLPKRKSNVFGVGFSKTF